MKKFIFIVAILSIISCAKFADIDTFEKLYQEDVNKYGEPHKLEEIYFYGSRKEKKAMWVNSNGYSYVFINYEEILKREKGWRRTHVSAEKKFDK